MKMVDDERINMKKMIEDADCKGSRRGLRMQIADDQYEEDERW